LNEVGSHASAWVAARDFDFAYFIGMDVDMAFTDVLTSEDSPRHFAAALCDQARGALIAGVNP
jgi:hypothetical protein